MTIRETLRSMGPLRNMLDGLAVVFILILPFSEPKRVLQGWDLFFGGVIPATAPIVFIILMFDVMMCQIMKSDGDAAVIARFNLIVKTHVSLGIVLLGLWLFSYRQILFSG